MTIEDIFRRGELSIRARNICNSNQIKTLNDLKQYYVKNKTFRNIRSCGEISNNELIEIYNKYKDVRIENKITQPVSTRKAYKNKSKVKLEKVVTDLHDVMKVTLTEKDYLKELEKKLQEHWSESATKETTATVDLEELEEKLKVFWKEKYKKSDAEEADVSEAKSSPEEIEKKLEKHWSDSRKKEAPQITNFTSSINLFSNLTDVIDFEEIEHTIKSYKRK